MFHFENQYWKWCRMLKKDVKNVCWKVKIKCSKLICIFFLTATKAICTYFFVLTAIMNHSNSQIGLAAKESFQWGLPPLNPFIWAMSGGELSWSYRNNAGIFLTATMNHSKSQMDITPKESFPVKPFHSNHIRRRTLPYECWIRIPPLTMNHSNS